MIYFVCLSPPDHKFKPIFTKLHHMVEFVTRKKPIVLRSKGQHWPKVNNWGGISKSSIFIRFTWNLKSIFVSGYWIQPPIILEVHIGQRSTETKILKSSIFIRFTWNLKRSCIFGHWIQPPIIFSVKSVLWILQVSCSARRLIILPNAERFARSVFW